MIYDVVNPSDPVSFVAPDRKIAALVCLLIGRGQYSGRAYNESGKPIPEEDVPFFMFGGLEEFLQAAGAGPVEGAVERNAEAIIAALETVALADVNDRMLFDAALRAITEDAKREAFLAEWNDRNRSSLNDIMGRAHAIAKQLRGKHLTADEGASTCVPPSIFVRP